MRFPVLGLVLLALAGCSSPTVPVAAPTPVAVIHPRIPVADAEALVEVVLARYVAVTNDVFAGRAPSDAIAEVTTPEWAVEEASGFAAAAALDSSTARVDMTKWQVSSVRGTNSVVDVIAAVCFESKGVPTHVTVRLVPGPDGLVISDIVPWEDATWCLDSPSL